jgi:hypothetical protein
MLVLSRGDLLPFKDNIPRWVESVEIMLGYFIPSYIVVKIFFKEDYIKSLKYTESSIRRGNIILLWYVIISITSVFCLILFKR